MSGDLSDGFFIEPTIFDGLASEDYIAQEEVFGPVLSILTFRDEDEAVALANDTRYGLAGYVHTKDLQRAPTGWRPSSTPATSRSTDSPRCRRRPRSAGTS